MLEKLLLGGAPGITDAGVCYLLDAAPATLLEVDAVSCVGVTHATVLHAAALRLPRMIVRRLPRWFARRWRCVRHRRIPVDELHAYFADGTFAFERETQASGAVLSFTLAPPVDGAPPHFQLVAQYDDEEALAQIGLPQWRPGVCVRQSGAREMHTAQRVSVNNTSCPDTLPLADEPGICTGLWRAEEDAEGAPAEGSGEEDALEE